MPRTLDVDARDRAVVGAAWRVIERGGLPALSVRTLAAEAGLPPSSLRTTFPSQRGVRRAAATEALVRLRHRIDAAPDAPREVLLALLPLDADRRAEASVLAAVRAAADPDLRAIREEADEAVLGACERVAAALGDQDAVAVQLLHAAVDGLAARLVQDPEAAPSALAVVERLLVRPGSPAR